MKKKVVSILLLAAMATSLLAGCGGKDSGTQTGNTTNAGGDTAGGDTAAEEGQVINIYSFNNELQTRITAVYPEIESTSEDGTTSTLKDGRVIHWIINPNQDGVYQDKLDEALSGQMSAAADDRVDIFAAEIDYVVKYTDADIDAAMTLESLGINPETDLADQFGFTKTVASDQNGVMRASTWQACPASWYIAAILQRKFSVRMILRRSARRLQTGQP